MFRKYQLVPSWSVGLETVELENTSLCQITVQSEGQYVSGVTKNRLEEWCAAQRITINSTISNRPWSQVWHVTDHSGRACILKGNRFVRPGGDRLHATLTEVLGPNVPALLASHPHHGLYLFEDAGAGEVSTEEALGVYGKAQATFAGNTSALDAIPLVCAVDVLDHFALLIADDDIAAATNIFKFFDAETLDNLRRNIDAHGRVLRSIAERVDTFAPTVNHCDLIPDNALRRQDGSVCICDWDDAIRSAPGWSLTPSFSGCVRVYAALRETSLYRTSTERDKDRNRMAIYMAGLTQHDAYAPRDLLQIVPATAIFGALREATTLAPYDLSVGSNSKGRGEKIAKVLSGRLSQVFRAALLVSSADSRGRPLPPSTLPIVDMADTSVDPADVAKKFREAGAVHLKGCFTPELIEEAAAEFMAGQERHQKEIQDGAALRVGDRRHMVTLDTDGIFGRPEMLASERLLSIFDHLLGSRFILGSATAVVSHPGGRPQRWHRDNFALFEEAKTMDLPPILISAIVPLVPINNVVGSTQIAVGSNQDRDLDETICPLVEPQTELGDCYLMDSSLMHRGMPNQSNGPRPIVALVYQRPWYVDVENFGRQERIRMSETVAKRLPEARHHLVHWALPK